MARPSSLVVIGGWGVQAATTLLRRYPEPALWLGWSLGAHVAMATAQTNPQSVDQVVILGVSPAIFQRFERYFERQPQAWAQADSDQNHVNRFISAADFATTAVRPLPHPGE